jgi:hypothetical protein
MKSIKLALMGGAALAVTAAAAHADDLDALKAQIEALNARVAAMEAAPAVPAGYSLLAMSEGPMVQTPGLPMTNKEAFAAGDTATYISVLPTADAPAGTTITWSGYVKAGVVYTNTKYDNELRVRNGASGSFVEIEERTEDDDSTDILSRGQVRVTGVTDTAVGEVGVDIRLRGNFNGNGNANVIMPTAWGYWAMTPEVTFGGGYAGSLGNIGYGYDGACVCLYTDNASVDFNPGDTTQLRLSYASGPLAAAVAFEDASYNPDGNASDATGQNPDGLGVAGEIKYTGDVVNGEISAVWRSIDDGAYEYSDNLWQVGAGLGFSLGDMATLSLAAAYGAGPWQNVASNSSNEAGDITTSVPYDNTWWGVSGLLAVNLTDEVHAEIAAGYKDRDGDDADDGEISSEGIQGSVWAIMGGIYYDPVPQLTIGVEAEYYVNTASAKLTCVSGAENACGEAEIGDAAKINLQSDNFVLDFTGVWRF